MVVNCRPDLIGLNSIRTAALYHVEYAGFQWCHIRPEPLFGEPLST